MQSPTSTPTHSHVSERVIARLWEEQRHLAHPLVTTTGERIQVVYRGRWRWDRGPDFTGALLAVGDGPVCHGDVEIHVRSADWRLHSHHRDPHYNSVILHIVLWNEGEGSTARQDGTIVPVVSLAGQLSVPLESLPRLEAIEAPLPSPCWRGSTDPGGDLGALLDRCGVERFAGTAARFEADLTCCPPDQLLYRRIAGALGYSQNRSQMERLAEMVPLDLALALRSRPAAGAVGRAPDASYLSFWALEALLLGSAGLLPVQRERSAGDPYALALEEWWDAHHETWATGALAAREWEFFRVRPSNFPTRRVAALARLVAEWPEGGLAEALAGVARSVEPPHLPRALESMLLRNQAGGYWARHSDFGSALPWPASLVGRQRAAEATVNVILPFLRAWAAILGDGELGARLRQVYVRYPKRGDNELTRYVAGQITTLARPRVARSACRQQGLLHLYRAYCETKRCSECPVATPA